MVDSFANVISNVNQIYMAALMTAAMVLIEIVVMWGMYKNKKLNTLIIILGTLGLILSFVFIRKQTFVSDRQFVKSMIPHHAAAILMVKETKLTDPELQKLAADIISAQQKEIDFMKAKLKELENN
jgi:cell shape-determining protein MreC